MRSPSPNFRWWRRRVTAVDWASSRIHLHISTLIECRRHGGHGRSRCIALMNFRHRIQRLIDSQHLPSLTSLLLRGLSSLASSLPFHSSSRNMNITVSNEMTGSGISYSPSASASVPRSFCGICRASRFLRRISTVAGGNAFIMK